MPPYCTASGADIILMCQVKTRCPKEAITHSEQGLTIRLKAIREKGKANEALREFLGEFFDKPKSDIEIISGFTSTKKQIKIYNLTVKDCLQKLKLG